MMVLETTVNELKVECERAQKPRFQVRLTLLPKRRTTSSTTWTLTSRRRRLPRSGSSRLWQNRSWRDSTASGPTRWNEDGCLRQGHEDEERRSLPAQLRRRSSLKSRCSQQGSLKSMVRKESPERAQRATILGKMTCLTMLREGLRPTAREVGEVRGHSQRSRAMR